MQFWSDYIDNLKKGVNKWSELQIHEQTKRRFISIFFDFLSDCIHLENQVKPIEVIRYEALQNGLEYLLTALTGCQVLLKFAFMTRHLKNSLAQKLFRIEATAPIIGYNAKDKYLPHD